MGPRPRPGPRASRASRPRAARSRPQRSRLQRLRPLSRAASGRSSASPARRPKEDPKILGHRGTGHVGKLRLDARAGTVGTGGTGALAPVVVGRRDHAGTDRLEREAGPRGNARPSVALIVGAPHPAPLAGP